MVTSARSWLSLVVLMSGSLAACGDEDGPAADTAARDASVEGSDASAPDGEEGTSEPDAGVAADAASNSPEADASDAGELDAAANGEDANVPLPVTIAFEGRVGDAAFSCTESYANLGSAPGLATQISDLRFYVHDVRLINNAGESVPVTLSQNIWQHQNVALIDLEDREGACSATGTAATNAAVVGSVPAAASYTGVSFVVGVPEALNHLDPAAATTPSPLNIQAMAWSWAAGRKFLRIDTASTATGVIAPAKFVVHLGSTFCTGNPQQGEAVSCTNPNRVPVTLMGFDPAASKIVLDVKELLSDSALDFNTPMTAFGCMSASADPECQAVFAQLGLDLSTGIPPSPATAPQSTFRVVAK